MLEKSYHGETPKEHAGLSFGNTDDQSHEKQTHTHIQLSLRDEPVKNSGWLYFVIGKEITQLYDLYQERGVNIIYDLTDTPWNMTEFHIKDIDGHTLRFAYNFLEGDDQ